MKIASEININKKTISLSVILIVLLLYRCTTGGFSEIYKTCGIKPDAGPPIPESSHERSQIQHLHAVKKKMFGEDPEYKEKMKVWSSEKCRDYRKSQAFIDEGDRYRSYMNYRSNKKYR